MGKDDKFAAELEQDGQLPPAYLPPFNFVKNAFLKGESFFENHFSKFANFSKFENFPIFCWKKLNLSEKRRF